MFYFSEYFVFYLETEDQIYVLHRDDKLNVIFKGKGPFHWLGDL